MQIDGLAALRQISEPDMSLPLTRGGTTGLRLQRLAARQPPPPPRPLDTLPRALRGPWPVVAILVVQTALALRLVWSNTAFQDEALYLWAGHLEWLHWTKGLAIPDFATYFSGAPVLYPPIGAVADGLGGLAGARLLSTGFMLGATVLLWSTTRRMFGRRAALGAAGLFAVLGVVQFLSAFATYDAMALFLLALATWLTVREAVWHNEFLLVLAAVVLTLANATKYASALWDPVVIILAGLYPPGRDPFKSVLRSLRLTVYVAIGIAVALKLAGHSYVIGILFTTVSRKVEGVESTPSTVLHDSFDWIGIVVIFALVGLGAIWKQGPRQRLLVSTLILAALLAPANQARLHTTVSLHKHCAFGAWFACIAAGYAVSRAAEVHRWKGWRIGVAAIAFTAVIGFIQANSMYITGWPNTTQTNSELAAAMPSVGCPCLLSDYTIADYYLNIQSKSWNISGPYAFSYWSNTLRKDFNGIPAYEQAIKEHYFTIIQLDPAASSEVYDDLVAYLKKNSQGYVLVSQEHDSFDPKGTIEIWEYRP
jgi:hypothetical protein